MARIFRRECNDAPAKSSEERKVPTLPLTFTTEASETTEQEFGK